MKKTVFSLLLITIILFCSCTTKVKDNTTKDNPITKKTDNTTTSEVSTTGVRTFYTKEFKEDPADPYSILLKKRCNDLVSYWQGANEEDKQFGFDYYIKYFNDLYYFLYDLDKDGTNELLLGTIQKVGTDYEDIYAPEKICISSIYTIKDGKAVKVDTGSWWEFVIIIDRILYSNGVIVVKWGNEEIPCYAAWLLENEKLNIKCYVRHSAGDPEKGYYKAINFNNLGETSISKDEYYSIYNQYCGNAKVVDIDWKRIDEYSVK